MNDANKITAILDGIITDADCMVCGRLSDGLTGVIMKDVEGKIIPARINGVMHYKIFLCNECLIKLLNQF